MTLKTRALQHNQNAVLLIFCILYYTAVRVQQLMHVAFGMGGGEPTTAADYTA